MRYSLPRYLYKYRSLATSDDVKHAAEIFEDHILYLATVETYNDPFECRFEFNFRAFDWIKIRKFAAVIQGKYPGISPEEAKEEARKLILGPPRPPTRSIEQTVSAGMVDRVRKEMGVLSLTKKRDPILMWSHYADKHRGICLQFDTSVSEATSVLRGAMPVRYRKRIPVLRYFRLSTKLDVDMAYDTAARKSEVWKYENEWRIIKVDAPRTKVAFPPRALSGVILGKEISQENKDLVRGWVARQGHPVTVHQADLHPRKYSLTFTPLGV